MLLSKLPAPCSAHAPALLPCHQALESLLSAGPVHRAKEKMDVAFFVAPSSHSPCKATSLPHCSSQAPLTVAQITQVGLWSPQTPHGALCLLGEGAEPKEGASEPSSAAAQPLTSPAPARRAAASCNAAVPSLPHHCFPHPSLPHHRFPALFSRGHGCRRISDAQMPRRLY